MVDVKNLKQNNFKLTSKQKDGNARLTTVPLKPLSYQKCARLFLSFKKVFYFDISTCFCEVEMRSHFL